MSRIKEQKKESLEFWFIVATAIIIIVLGIYTYFNYSKNKPNDYGFPKDCVEINLGNMGYASNSVQCDCWISCRIHWVNNQETDTTYNTCLVQC